jgi:hydroxylaminobenzene mutase
LFLLWLVVGLVEEKFTNPRMGLAAHLEGVMNGTFLVALGAIWTEVRLSARSKAAAYWGALYGSYGNWVITSAAAIFGTASMTPITAMGHRGQAWQETFVTFGFASVGIAIIVALVLILWGLRGNVLTRPSTVSADSDPEPRPRRR